MNTLSHFMLSQSCRGLKNTTLGGPRIPFLDQKVLSRLAEYDDVIRGPGLSLPLRTLLKLNPFTVTSFG